MTLRRITLRHCIALCCCLFGLLSLPTFAAESTDLDPLLIKLAEVKMNDMVPVLVEIEATSEEAVLPIFQYLVEGSLHYIKTSKQLVAQVEVSGVIRYKDLLTGQVVADLSKSDVDKIRVNNTLRVYLRNAIARIQLSAKSPSVRESAVRSLLSKLDQETVATLESLYPNETNKKVKEAMALALAMNTAAQTQLAPSNRIAAIDTLSTSLESDVRNLLTQLTRDGNAAVVSAANAALEKIAQRVNRFAFVDQLFFGLSLGSVLLLASIGLAITFGVMGVINMAHGEMIMLGAYTTYVVQLIMPNYIDYSIWVAIPAAFLVSGLMGVLIERLVICRLHGRPLETLLATFGISLILQQLVRTIFSPLNRQVSTPSWMSGSWEINPVLSLTLNRLYILAFALLVFIVLVIVLKKTSLGLNVRAVSQNRNMAKAMGVKTHWVDAMTFGLGSGIAGIAGVALSQLTNVGPNLGQSYIIDSFMVVVFGGVGNLLGTLVAAFTLGIATKFLEPTTGAVLAAILVLVFIILFIQKRPKGLFPQKGRAAE
ncbi:MULTISPECIES: urea ABC transporter permease subunit UrtB [Marinomonas]|uniref:Urea ABC transporter permease subunit UrtB n=1 Tax=Marinomonas arctica TaxID=383750 RepID=A0A7H1J424_9GAMM|nr:MULTISPECIES: urea ABC transporter permease subunit UrtB [Marinomonas]MCS7487773.1 urea ABC transporter permease [Marinomonas sp. BSi20414]QNT05240.1 urea ABC transporter permease subunit UrtB [Marinomonas arctica]